MAEFDLEVGAAMRLYHGDDGLMPTLQIAGGCQQCRLVRENCPPARVFARGFDVAAPAAPRIAAIFPSRVHLPARSAHPPNPSTLPSQIYARSRAKTATPMTRRTNDTA